MHRRGPHLCPLATSEQDRYEFRLIAQEIVRRRRESHCTYETICTIAESQPQVSVAISMQVLHTLAERWLRIYQTRRYDVRLWELILVGGSDALRH